MEHLSVSLLSYLVNEVRLEAAALYCSNALDCVSYVVYAQIGVLVDILLLL